ncbi:ScbR family autoregulator-binding transcription factor [Streptomyces griseomycini]|uniref:AcrR family transcriptional regulator n=1 Tax=Streptomyces griseomycini TaxID=66895 RepID=A0A7W7V9T3_9ACTN|nr:ScbR family autoregulator-binding transcription factor [Streptomyces griseomycini]MBB4902127.1 AcrR family transcriptional regulator [Streptomyces griseomycini]GGQ19029.1 TetR family transcriptional regulator [Streptomyces griseomycini]GGR37331.1 TetR family transcriptional regulator [Streptomyces griseomycini]
MQDRARATRKALLESAAHLFVERGYAGTSVNDISDHSGKTSGAIYFHYSSKEKLALAVVRERFATWPQLAAAYAAPGVPPLEKLVGLSFRVAQSLSEDVVARAGARLWAERHTIEAVVPTPFDAWAVAATRLLTQARARGELAEGVGPSAAAVTLVSAFFGLCTLTDEMPGGRGWRERLEQWWTLVLRSLQADPDPAALLARVRVGGPARPGDAAPFRA